MVGVARLGGLARLPIPARFSRPQTKIELFVIAAYENIRARSGPVREGGEIFPGEVSWPGFQFTHAVRVWRVSKRETKNCPSARPGA